MATAESDSMSAILQAAEPLFQDIQPNEQGLIPFNCGDGRWLVPGQQVDHASGLYANKFGGRDGVTWDVAVLMHDGYPAGLQKDWLEFGRYLDEFGLFKNAGLLPMNHSDEHCEGHGATALNSDTSISAIGCGRLEKGEEIAMTPIKHFDEIFKRMLVIAPGAFDADEERAHELAEGNAALATLTLPNGQPFMRTGRELVTTAEKTGTPALILADNHIEEDAIGNLRPNTTLNNSKNQKHFAADFWLMQEIVKNNPDMLPNAHDALIQDALISLATKLVLTGRIDDVAVRS